MSQLVGILALQGSFAEHGGVLRSMGVDFVWVKDRETLERVTHLIIPGGESTTMRKLLEAFEMWGVLEERTAGRNEKLKMKNEKCRMLKIFGTCAGAILCADLGMGVEIERNGYGAQQESFETVLESELFPGMEGVFIRAPKFSKVKRGEVLASFEGEPVLVCDGPFLAATFHPELVEEERVYRWFLNQ